MKAVELKGIRAGLQLTQAQLASAFGVPLGSINRMEIEAIPIERRTALAVRYLELIQRSDSQARAFVGAEAVPVRRLNSGNSTVKSRGNALHQLPLLLNF